MTMTMDNIPLVPINEIFIDEYFNCRDGIIQPYTIKDLAENISRNGLIQPVTLMPHEKDGFKYKLVSGFRRTKAHILLGRESIKAIVDESITSDFKARLFNLSENLCRKDLNILEEAKALEVLVDMGMSFHEIGAELNQSYGWVQERSYLLALPEVLQAEASAGWLSGQLVRQFYSVQIKFGTKKVLEAAKAAKEKLQRGEKVRVTNKRHSLFRKRKPSTSDMQRIQELMYDVIGAGLETRILGWAQGALSEFELYCYLEMFAKKRGIHWELPKVTNEGYIVTEEANLFGEVTPKEPGEE